MFETPITVVGRIVTDPRRRVVADQEVIRDATDRAAEGDENGGLAAVVRPDQDVQTRARFDDRVRVGHEVDEFDLPDHGALAGA